MDNKELVPSCKIYATIQALLVFVKPHTDPSDFEKVSRSLDSMLYRTAPELLKPLYVKDENTTSIDG